MSKKKSNGRRSFVIALSVPTVKPWLRDSPNLCLTIKEVTR